MEFYRRIDFYISVAALFLVVVLIIYIFYQNYIFVQEVNELSSKFQNHVRLTEPITSTFQDPKGFVQALSAALNEIQEFNEDLNRTTYDNFGKISKQLEGANVPVVDFEEIVEPWLENRRRTKKKKTRPSSRWENDDDVDEGDDHKSYINDQVRGSRRNRGRA